jgi:hypothetical protein
LRNEAGVGLHWVGVELRGKNNADTAGAKVTVETGGRKQTRFAVGGGSYLSACDRRLLFGLGSYDGPVRVTVVWPGGREQAWDGLTSERYWRLEAGSAKAGG